MEAAAVEAADYAAVGHALAAALSHEARTRGAAESTLRDWEADAAPNFLKSLISIVKQTSIDEVPLQRRGCLGIYTWRRLSLAQRETVLWCGAGHQAPGHCGGQERGRQLVAENAGDQGVVKGTGQREGRAAAARAAAALHGAQRAHSCAAGAADHKHRALRLPGALAHAAGRPGAGGCMGLHHACACQAPRTYDAQAHLPGSQEQAHCG